VLLDEALRLADIIFHLAGVNRPQKEEEFHIGKIIEYQVRGEDY